MDSIGIALGLLALPALLATGYLGLLTVASARRPPHPAPRAQPRFAVVVPAHDEESGIGRTVASLRALAWPSDRLRVLVVADNCSDATAERAAAAGATVLVRRDRTLLGKGHALRHAFEHLLAEGWAEAAVVVDADTVASANLLSAFAARLEGGAEAAQARYGVLNADASWRTRLMAVAFAMFHDVRSLGRERLGLSCGLRGNGMCFAAAALRQRPYDAFSVVEDVEYGLRLGEAGIRVAYAHEASVLGEMVPGEAASRSQRVRWEAGRGTLARSHGLPLLARALSHRSPVLLDLALDLLVPPLSWVGAWVAVGSAAAVAAWAWGLGPAALLLPWGLALLLLALHVLRGVQLSGLGLAGLAALAWAPAYMAWKVPVLLLRGRASDRRWVRTARAAPPPGPPRPPGAGS